MPKRPDCLTCGLCCSPHQDQEVFCDVDDVDLRRLDIGWVRRNVLATSMFDLMCSRIDGRPFPAAAIKTRWKKITVGPLQDSEICVCAALTGNPMHRVSCTIYSHRPRACRESVKPGDRSCHQIRKFYQEFLER